MSPNPIVAVLDLVEPYLPSSISRPLYTLLTTPTSALSDPTQLLPLLLSAFALYAAVLSTMSTLRSSVRLAMFGVKWGAIAAIIGVLWSGYNNMHTEEGPLKGVRTAQGYAEQAYGVGRTGLNWWMGNSANRGGRKTSKRKAANGRSPSGARRTWATANDDGGWDDPAEVDIGAGARGGQSGDDDVMGFVKRAAMTFLAPGQAADDQRAPRAKTRANTQKKKAKRNAGNADGGLGDMATEYAMGRARRAWNDFMGGGRQ